MKRVNLCRFITPWLCLFQMFRKKRSNGGKPFYGNSDPRRSSGQPTVICENAPVYKRYDQKLVSQVCKNSEIAFDKLPGVHLRPLTTTTTKTISDNDSTNDVIDLEKLDQAHKLSMKLHRQYSVSKRSLKHIPNLKIKKIRNQGFGVHALYICTACRFSSTPFALFQTTATGACVTNVAAGVAFSKTTVKPSDAEFLFSTLNINGPCRSTFQKHFTQVNTVAQQVVEQEMSHNRGVLRDYVAIRDGKVEDRPGVGVTGDGQYDERSYHGYDGTSKSVSEPILEVETGMDLLVSHAVVSKLDGSYEKDKVRLQCLFYSRTLELR